MTVLLTVLFQVATEKVSIHAGYQLEWGSGLGTKQSFQAVSNPLKTRTFPSVAGFFVM
jgi:hypothetical protein